MLFQHPLQNRQGRLNLVLSMQGNAQHIAVSSNLRRQFGGAPQGYQRLLRTLLADQPQAERMMHVRRFRVEGKSGQKNFAALPVATGGAEQVREIDHGGGMAGLEFQRLTIGRLGAVYIALLSEQYAQVNLGFGAIRIQF